MPINIREIPQVVIDKKNEFSKTQLEGTNFPLKLFPLDAFDEVTGTGFSSKEGFVSTVLSGETATVFDVSLRPSISIETKNFSVGARWIKNITNYSQREEDVASLIYSQERPVYQIDTELDLRDKLIFWTQNNIYGIEEGGITLEISKETPVFEIDSYDPQYDENGVFQYATLILKRVISWKAKKQSVDGSGAFEYVQFNFFRANVQPINARRRRRTWKSKPIKWFTEIRGADTSPLDWSFTPNTQGKGLATPFLPRKIGGTKINFVPSFLNEVGYWNANRQKFKMNVKGYIRDSGTISSLSDGTLIFNEAGGFPDITPGKGAIYTSDGSFRYKVYSFVTDITQLPDRGALFQLLSETLDLFPPFNFSGGIREDSINNFGERTLSRKEDTDIALWNTFITQSIWQVDLVSNGNNSVIANIWEMYFSDIRKNPNVDNELIDLQIVGILRGQAIVFGQTINLRPPSSYDKDFDFNPNPKDWNVEDIKKYTGVFFFEEELGVDGSSIELQLTPITEGDIPTKTGTRYEISALFNTYFEVEFGSSLNVKQRLCGRDWYLNYNEEWVEEIEWDTNQEFLTSEEDLYFGGYEYTDEWFSNSYEDSLINGDIPCKFSFGPTEYNLPPLTNRSANRKGNPLSYGEKRIWGTGGAMQEQKTILTKANERNILLNKKTLVNINNGKKVKNIRYNKNKR